MADALTHSIPRSVWHGWGDPREAKPLSDRAWRQLSREVGAKRQAAPARPVAIEDVVLPESRLSADDAAALAAVVGREHVATDRVSRIEHAGGKSYPDIRRLRFGDGGQAPDAVVFPGTADEVVDLLAVCSARRLAVVPFGGGTSVVGGVSGDIEGGSPVDAALAGANPLDPTTSGSDARAGEASGRHTPDRLTAVVTVDLRRLNRLLALDTVSRIATFEPGIRGPEIEAALHPHGLTLGHYPQSHQEATLGGYVATRSAGQASTGYGRIDEVVVGARLATPRGELIVGGRAPASAAGPRLLDVVVGSEGALGIITEASVRVAPLPSVKRYAACAFPSFEAAAEALREMAQELGHGVLPDVCRLSDAEETRVSLTLAGRGGAALSRWLRVRGLKRPCLALFVWEGREGSVLRSRARRCEAVFARFGARSVPSKVTRAWEHGRFSGPYLRDELMGHGVLADTLETATTWENLGSLHEAVGAAIGSALVAAGTPGLVQCHVSHVYAAGASLYYTFVAREAADPVAQWAAVKAAASSAIVAGGGTITHHHAVGRDHREFLGAEIGGLGVEVLRAVKSVVDPAGVLNPGTLLP